MMESQITQRKEEEIEKKKKCHRKPKLETGIKVKCGSLRLSFNFGILESSQQLSWVAILGLEVSNLQGASNYLPFIVHRSSSQKFSLSPKIVSAILRYSTISYAMILQEVVVLPIALQHKKLCCSTTFLIQSCAFCPLCCTIINCTIAQVSG